MRKPYFSKSKRAQIIDKQRILKLLNKTETYLQTIGLEIEKVKIKNIEINSTKKKKIQLDIVQNKDDNLKEIKVIDILKVKDQNNISDKAYQALRNLSLKIPSLHQIKKERKLLNSVFDINIIPEGAYANINNKLDRIIPFLIRHFPDKFVNREVIIKFSGDGTNICRNIKILNFTFTIINEGQIAKTASGNYTLGVFEIEAENHEELVRLFKDIAQQIDGLKNTIDVDGTLYTLKKKFGGDWMFLSAMLGINSPTSNYPCIYCKWYNGNLSVNNYQKNGCKRKQREDTLEETNGNEYSIIDIQKNARTIKESINLSEKNIQKYGYISNPIIKSIEIYDYVFCSLHLFLRISDKLENLFFSDLEEIDYLHKTKNQLKYLDDLKNKYKINHAFHKVDNKLKLNSLMGPLKEKIFKNIKLDDYGKEHEKIGTIQEIWNEFWSIYNDLRKNVLSANEVKLKTANWWIKFTSVYHKSHETPYIHLFVNHLHEFIDIHGDVNSYSQQGLEKLNDLTTSQFFRGTNKKNFLKQILEKRNRLELYLIN